MKILIADDDVQILRALRITLGAYGYEVVTAESGSAAIRKAVDTHPDLLVLDLGMPGLSGMDVIEAVRGWSAVPILVVSGRVDPADKVRALDLGADDYVTKPFSTEELLARIRALSRRVPAAAGPSEITFGAVRVDLAARRIARLKDGADVRLTPTEWRFLSELLAHPGMLVTQQTLLHNVWGPGTTDSGYLRLYIGQLRRKLEADPASPAHLLTEHGMGYRFVP
ncbi:MULTISPECIES: response regulator [unclassified Arthrobacter]|uniref:response regulator n=1 Tax=unclassified Arthrobacter TaxID=235627 RepID=UPI001D137888|nr:MULTISPECIES: response regulator [unclassified Arthrobacter]MCC3274625.1 response regulator [Arthrobacter sp. zg-Y20]MCC3279400.1 response regulator [Arthrobacter sp. zg-Y40]MCC9177785.1 response regulator [Arthrobacter sp. zg-Y750]MDK1314782.1 response regulator [Arthrobacter sp. zg.Y20]MDK1327648.1 response regulator [Arthrobacter sp. zg-Y1143]